jgi:hydrogenase expression/formation protein HypD
VKYVDEFRDPQQAADLSRAIATAAKGLTEKQIRLMEVCGTHTMAIFRFGLRQMLPENIGLISGPGCPVCVTATSDIDRAVELCQRQNVTVVTFGDMVRVPGTSMSLAQAQAQGGRVEVVYSAFDALKLARQSPGQEFVFMGIGFETTAPTVAAALYQAREEKLANFSVLSSHKVLPPALEALLGSGKARVSGFIMPGHVTTIIGAQAYEQVAKAHGLPCVVSGFEPNDILASILMLIRELTTGDSRVLIQYQRGATWEGNRIAQKIMQQVFAPADALWRGLGLIPGSGLEPGPEFAPYDAALRFDLPRAAESEVKDPPGCRCGEVLQGLITPQQCSLFKKACTPRTPVGPCMVSSEGTCAAYFKYAGEAQP